MGMSNENELRIPLESDNAQHSQEESAELHSSFHSETQSFIIDYKDDDVLLGRGKSNATHIGNIRFQELITDHCDLYLKAPTHQAKKDVCEEILKLMRGRFLRFVSTRNGWVEISEEAARIKVAQAFQYRQRRGGLIDGHHDDISGQKLDTYNRKRTAATLQATWPPVINLEAHRTMQSMEPLTTGDTQVTTDEILWALGMQPSLPEQQEQHHSPNPLPYGDDLAIGRPAANLASQMQRQYEAFPSPSMSAVADRNAALSFSSMLASAAVRTESTATSLLQAQLSQQARLFQASMPQDAGQSQHLPQSVAQLSDIYRQVNPLNVSNISSYSFNNSNIREIGPQGIPVEAQSLQMPLSLQIQQSVRRDNESEASRTVDAFTNNNSMMDGYMVSQQQSPTFDSSFVPLPAPSLHQVRSSSVSDSFPMRLPEPIQIHDLSQRTTATTSLPYDVSSLEPNELLLDPLPLDDDESLRSFGKQDANDWRNIGPP